MNRLFMLIWGSLLCCELVAQQRIDCSIHPPYDAPATIQLQANSTDRIQLIFDQTGKWKSGGRFTWDNDTTKLMHVRRMGRYFQRFAFSDTVTVTAQEAPVLFKIYREIIAQASPLAKQKDDRLRIDGLRWDLTVFTDSSTSYRMEYRAPDYAGGKLVNQFIENILMSLKMKSRNPATVNYCMVVDTYKR